MSVQDPPVRTVLLVKIFLEVTDASVNLDILDETVKLVSFVRLKNFIRYTNFHLAFLWIFLVISLSCMSIIINNFLLLYFIKQLDSVSGGMYSNKWEKRHNVVITLVTHFIAEPCFLLLLLFLTLRCHPWSRREARQHWIYLLLNRELIFNYIYRCGRVHRFSLQKRCSMSKCSRQLSMQL